MSAPRKRLSGGPESKKKQRALQPDLSPSTGQPPHCANINTGHAAEVSAAWEGVINHDAFKGIQQMDPLTLQEGGQVSPIDYDVLKAKMAQGQLYQAGVNAAWVSWSWTVTPDVPVNRTGVPLLN